MKNLNINKAYLTTLLTITFFIGMSATDIYLPSLPVITDEFNITPNVTNYTLSVFTWGTAILVLFSSVLSDRYGRKKIFMMGLIVFAICSFLISTSHSIYMFIFLRFIQSIGPAFIIIISRLILKDVMTPEEQVKANGIMLSALILSPAIAPVIGAHLAKLFGWRSCFIFTGIVSSILILLLFKKMPETNAFPLSKMPSVVYFLRDHFYLLKSQIFCSLLIMYVSSVAAFFAFLGISSYLYINTLLLSPVAYSYCYFILALGYLSGNQLMLFLNKKNIHNFIIIKIGIYAALIGVFVMISSIFLRNSLFCMAIVITAGAFLMRSGNAMINPTTQVFIMNYFGRRGGYALGLLMFMNFSCMGLSIFLVSLFYKTPLIGLLLLSFIFSVIALLAFIFSENGLINVNNKF